MLGAVECKVEIAEEDTGSDVVCGPQVLNEVKLKVEPPDENPEGDALDEQQMFEAVDMKVEPPEDNTKSDPRLDPQVFEFVGVKTEPCKGSPKGTDANPLELQASASAAKGANSRNMGGKAPLATSRKSKATIPRQARKIILNVAHWCEVEKKTKQLLHPLSDPLKRAAEYIGWSVENLEAARRSGDSTAPTPSKKRKMDSEKMEDIDERVIRETIEEFYTEMKMVPTLGKLASALREKTGCEWRSAAALRKTLKSLGFVWKKVGEEDGRTFLMERFSLVRRRSRFIVGMRYMREVGREIFYLDESWVNTNLECGKCGDEGGASGSLLLASSTTRLVVRSIGSRRGFLEGAQLTFRTVPSMKGTNAADFEKWFEESVLSNLPPASVIVMADTPHRCRQADPAPSVYDPKVQMVAWLRRRGINCDNTVMKYVLWELIRANGGSQKDYVVDQMASVRGHSVMRMPPNVRDLSAGYLVWAQIMEYVSVHATAGLSFTNLQKVAAAALLSVTDKDWERYCERVHAIEEDYWGRDGVMEDAVDDVIRNPDAPDSSDDSEGSITEDSETESD